MLAPLQRTNIVALRAGVLAGAFCARYHTTEVAAVFARSFYVRAGDDFVCVGSPEIGNGPLTIIADVKRHRITVADRVDIDLTWSLSWGAPGWPARSSPEMLSATLIELARRAVTQAPSEGLARLVLGTAAQTALDRAALPRIARFRRWLDEARTTDPAPVHDLIGLGHGLTPSGDDLLSGALALLDAVGATDAHAALVRTIHTAPADLTSPLSFCLLKATAAGHVGEHLHQAVSALLGGDVGAAIAAADRIGHSSGWDMLTGAVLALRAARSDA